MSNVNLPFFEDLRVAREDVLSLGFWAFQIYRFGHLHYCFHSKTIRYPLACVHIFLSKLSEIFFGITIGVSAKIGRRLIIEHSGGIVIHGNVVIGDHCIIRQGVTLGYKLIMQPLDAPSLGDRVNIGAGAKILGKVFIENDVDIGANAVVIKDIPSNSLAVGMPARTIPKTL